ncbi:MAG TPA: LrgB family protein [Patescibacteria group bacterium]|nr:LrgB family protein [Patescibacteria group bacterium]
MQTLIFPLAVILTLAAYLFSRRLYLRYRHPLLNIVLVSTSIVIGVLLVCGISYAQYVPAGNLMTLLLGPATVALAVPLYRNRHLLRCYFIAILVSTLFGALFSMITAGLIARAGGMSNELIVSLVPKSVTLPFAIDIVQIYGGSKALAVAFVVATGTLGSILGAIFLSAIRIIDPVARGLALGSVAHGQGTALALQEGEEAGSMAGLAMVLAGIMTTLLAPFLMPFLTR